MTRLVLTSPLSGWAMPLAQVPDPVFAAGMAGDGVAIDPTAGVLHAPCDGEIALLREARHALSLRAAGGVEILMHVGIDTVNLRGEGFVLEATHGMRVRAGDALLRFDLDLLARRAKSLVTPVLVAAGGRVAWRVAAGALAVGDRLLEIESADAVAVAAASASGDLRRRYRVPFDHGLHARPAARVAALLRPFAAEVTLHAHGRSGDAHSTVALMALGVPGGEVVEVVARGADSDAALAALDTLLERVHSPPAAPAVPAAPPESTPGAPAEVAAVIAARGIALGDAMHVEEPERAVVEAGAGFAIENERLRTSLAAVQQHLQARAAATAETEQAILAAHVELLQDPQLRREAADWMQRGRSAGFAWRQAVRATIAAISTLDDARVRERAADLRDLENQVLRALAGEAPEASHAMAFGAIALADEVLPSQLARLAAAGIAGICTARGGPTSHVALLAAAHGIPTLVAAGPGIHAIADGTPLLLDAERGVLRVAPSAAECAAARAAVARRTAARAGELAAASQPCRTTDGVAVEVLANIGDAREAVDAVALGADGCGLLRTEFLFLSRHEPPDEDEQARAYGEVAAAFAGRPVTLRTLDAGGDKPIAYLPMPHEDNPALGQRGLRSGLLQPALLRTQLLAMLRVRPARAVRILLPMVTDLADVRFVRDLLAECARALGLRELPAIGAMIETPASAALADQILDELDFVSIGTNDLSQYTLAMDRTHPQLAARLDGLHPAVLRLIAGVGRAGRAAGKPVAVCGGLASDPVAVPVLLGLGVHELSVVPALVPQIKGLVRMLGMEACEALAAAALQRASAGEVRALVERGIESPPRARIAEVKP